MEENSTQTRRVYDLLKEPRGSTYRELLAFSCPGQTALLVVRDKERLQQP